jgi:hypothetical protein
LNDFAWEKQDAIELIKSLMMDQIGILGGDVYQIITNELIPICDNWSCESIELQNEEFLKIKISSIKYLENYPILDGENIVFSIMFTEQL